MLPCSWNETLAEAWQPTRNFKFSWSWWPQTMKTRTAKWGNYYYGARLALVLAAIKMKRGLLSLESGAHLGSFSKRKHSSLIYSSACTTLSTSSFQTTKQQIRISEILQSPKTGTQVECDLAPTKHHFFLFLRGEIFCNKPRGYCLSELSLPPTFSSPGAMLSNSDYFPFPGSPLT